MNSDLGKASSFSLALRKKGGKYHIDGLRLRRSSPFFHSAPRHKLIDNSASGRAFGITHISGVGQAIKGLDEAGSDDKKLCKTKIY